MSKKEIYRSFEGKLDCDNQEGYILYSANDGNTIVYEGLSVWKDVNTDLAMFPARLLPPEDYDNDDKICEILEDCRCGSLPDGHIYYRGKWWSGKQITAIQQRNNDLYWQKYV